jgi:hypothetical protein
MARFSSASGIAPGIPIFLAAKLLPNHFSRLFVMEPMVMDPSADKSGGGILSEQSMAIMRQIRRRRAEFPSVAAAFQRLRTAPSFADWSEHALWA